MTRWRLRVALLGAAVCLAATVQAAAQDPSARSGPRVESLVEMETTARLLALLLDSGRAVINEHQPTGPGAGAAAVTSAVSVGVPAGLFEAELIETFRMRSGLDLRDLSEARLPARTRALLSELLEISARTVADAPDGVIPAVYGSRVAARFETATGVRLKQTALKPRNPANEPDSFERAALEEFSSPSYPGEQAISEVTAGAHWLRLMFPLYATRRCLDCHGEPKGELDRMGYPREGLRLGQNAGAISVMIPLER